MNKNMKYVILFVLTIGSSVCLFGQATFDEDVTDVPIDGGIVTVTLIAAAYGAKRKSKQNKESNDDI